MEKYPNAIPREIRMPKVLAEEKKMDVAKRQKQAVIMFVVGALLMALKDHTQSVIGVAGIVLSYAVLIMWIHVDFRMVLGDRVWEALRNKNKCAHCGVEPAATSVQAMALTGRARAVHGNRLCVDCLRDTYQNELRLSVNHGKIETERELVEGVERKVLHTNQIWHNYTIPSMMCFYCLMKDCHMKDFKQATKKRLLHGHSGQVIGGLGRLKTRLRLEKDTILSRVSRTKAGGGSSASKSGSSSSTKKPEGPDIVGKSRFIKSVYDDRTEGYGY